MSAEAAREAKDIVGDLAGGSTAAQGEAAVSTTASAEVGEQGKIKSGGR